MPVDKEEVESPRAGCAQTFQPSTFNFSTSRDTSRHVSETLAQAAKRALPIAQLGARRLLGKKSPFQVTFSLTNRCNFRCEYCHIPLQHRDEMTTGEWFGAIDDFCRGGMARASLIGGEPLLRK